MACVCSAAPVAEISIICLIHILRFNFVVPTKRKETAAISLMGVNYVRALVEKNNSIFQKVDLENDIGNDAYIEFIKDCQATGCCVAAQVKSGESYVSQDGSTFQLKADKDHFEYWASHSLPVCGIVFDPKTETAGWCDISEFLNMNPHVISQGPYQITISRDRVLNAQTYHDFTEHFLSYRKTYQSDQRFGEALERFAHRENLRICQDALRSLFSFHRQRFSTWFYLINSLRHFRGHPLLRSIVVHLCHIPSHGDIFWHKGNIIETDVSEAVLAFMKQALGKEEVIALLESIDVENGFSRGSIGQCVHSIIDVATRRTELLSSIALDPNIDEQIRFWAVHLLIFETQRISKEDAVATIRRYLSAFPQGEFRDALETAASDIQEHGWIGYY